MTDFCDLISPIWRTGITNERPAVPLSFQWMYWDRQALRLWAVNDSLQWVLVRPDLALIDAIVVDDDGQVVADEDGYVTVEEI